MEEEGIIVITCVSFTNPRWSFNDGSLPYNAVIQNVTLHIERAELVNNGYYECEGTTENNIIFYARGKVTVKGQFPRNKILLL